MASLPYRSARPNRYGGYPAERPHRHLAEPGARCAPGARVGVTVDPPVSFLDDVAGLPGAPSSPRRASESFPTRWRRAPFPLPNPDPELDALETAGKAVFNRVLRAMPRKPGWPSERQHADHSGDGRNAHCPHPVPPHRVHVTRVRSTPWSPPRFLFKACSPSQMANVRTYEITNSGVAAERNYSAEALLPSRRASRASRRRIQAGCSSPAIRCPAAPATSEQLRQPGPARNQQGPRPTSWSNTAATLEEVLDHYKAFFQRVEIQAPTRAPLLTTQPGVVPPVHDRPFTDAEVPALLAYLPENLIDGRPSPGSPDSGRVVV